MERAEDQGHLRSVQLLTDIALTRLDVDALLVELLDRVREVLRADTAAILLLDSAAQELVARAARGIEEEVYQDVRVPMRTGFAGRIAAERRPVLLDRVDQTTVANPILWEKGIRAMLGVPLLVGDNLIGVLHVGRLNSNPFNAEDAQLLELVAERVAFATQTSLLEIERAAARLLERSLLPRSLPSCPGLEMAARYATADGRDVGGDWYDVFVLPSGDLWVIAGDVAGHGLSAAVIMGRLRSTMRSYAFLGDPAKRLSSSQTASSFISNSVRPQRSSAPRHRPRMTTSAFARLVIPRRLSAFPQGPSAPPTFPRTRRWVSGTSAAPRPPWCRPHPAPSWCSIPTASSSVATKSSTPASSASVRPSRSTIHRSCAGR